MSESGTGELVSIGPHVWPLVKEVAEEDLSVGADKLDHSRACHAFPPVHRERWRRNVAGITAETALEVVREGVCGTGPAASPLPTATSVPRASLLLVRLMTFWLRRFVGRRCFCRWIFCHQCLGRSMVESLVDLASGKTFPRAC